jgi:acyl dehydratase
MTQEVQDRVVTGGEGARRVVALDDLAALVGQRIGVSRWHTVTQGQVDLFADATGDHQWIHVYPDRARSGPFGSTIAHGYLTLSLAPALLWDVLTVVGAGQVVNYGIGKARFPAPVQVGSRLRMAVDLRAVEEAGASKQATFDLTFEVEGSVKPACVAEILFRYYR